MDSFNIYWEIDKINSMSFALRTNYIGYDIGNYYWMAPIPKRNERKYCFSAIEKKMNICVQMQS